ncbi:hypothetical protein E2C01_095049 [Portunus trituberculatus]|uniref:Uncharacterized protein n=1 Tax=Portunus trituberculatus TaxID=210409 RepID=A0A5B7JU51_PORTR|nr:hypothetical protein [Portunus trituberculatus]
MTVKCSWDSRERGQREKSQRVVGSEGRDREGGSEGKGSREIRVKCGWDSGFLTLYPAATIYGDTTTTTTSTANRNNINNTSISNKYKG